MLTAIVNVRNRCHFEAFTRGAGFLLPLEVRRLGKQ
jgi:hypothetical protein